MPYEFKSRCRRIVFLALLVCLLLQGCGLAKKSFETESSAAEFYSTSVDAVRAALQDRTPPLYIADIEKQTRKGQWTSIVGTTRDYDAVADVNSANYSKSIRTLVALTKGDETGGYKVMELALSGSDAEFVDWIGLYSLPPELFYNEPESDTQWGGVSE